MSIRSKLMSALDKLRSSKATAQSGTESVEKTENSQSVEFAADEKIQTKAVKKAKKGSKKKASERSRPTNPEYQMIDPDDNTVDSGKS